MHALMALLDSRRTSDFKMLQRFHYPRELSQMVSEVEKLQEFEKCGEPDVRLLRKVKVVVPKNDAEVLKSTEISD
ncbi:unnamed protein product [Nippostrongylus brasiliensis]|uniref:FH2 domain-containing protein n=1 Tax=Nippostrongylus brasiliensis TaxID=27835 RepID=A0A0N4XJW6_NIPBR|nr:unnamed protein product [Nippostrongylus brasiliensis]VDL80110.1 unnamed protein product [Nippostrongylus brasiliensis]